MKWNVDKYILDAIRKRKCIELVSKLHKVIMCPCSFLKLYTTMPVAKLAGFLDMTEQEFRIQLLVFKHKMKNLVWTSGISALEGEFQSASEVDFYIDKVCRSLLNKSDVFDITYSINSMSWGWMDHGECLCQKRLWFK